MFPVHVIEVSFIEIRLTGREIMCVGGGGGKVGSESKQTGGSEPLSPNPKLTHTPTREFFL